MASTTFSNGTVIPVNWLNEVNALLWGSSSPPATPIRVNASGQVGIGGSPLGPFWVQMAASGMLVTQDADGFALIGGYTQAGGTKGFRVAGSNGLHLSGNGANVSNVIINSTGNVGVGVAPNSGWRAGAASMQLGAFTTLHTASNGAASLGFGLYEGGTNTYNYLTTGDAPCLYQQITGSHVWYNASSGTAGNSVSLSKVLEVDSSGNLIAKVNASAPTLSENSNMTFSLTSNTNLRISVRGTDGVTRVANITLA